jgi:Zn-dependent protease
VFLCILLHEFGHAFAARAFGVKTPDITLLPIGGIARLEKLPDKPWQELIVAVAGPAVNVVIVAVLAGAFGARFDLSWIYHGDRIEAARDLDKLAFLNAWLIVFNMVPAFPMDGGRVLRSLLAMRISHAAATRFAARVGKGLAIGFGLAGALAPQLGLAETPQPFWIIIAVVIFIGASQEASAAEMKELSADLRVHDAMVTRLETLTERSTLDDAVEVLLRTSQHEFPVLDPDGRAVGVLTRDGMIAALKRDGGQAPVGAAMHRDLPEVGEDTPFEEALHRMHAGGCPAVTVSDSTGRFIGLITPENVGELMMVRSLRNARNRIRWERGD